MHSLLEEHDFDAPTDWEARTGFQNHITQDAKLSLCRPADFSHTSPTSECSRNENSFLHLISEMTGPFFEPTLVDEDERGEARKLKQTEYSGFNGVSDKTTFSPPKNPISGSSDNDKLELTFLNSSEDRARSGRHFEVIHTETGEMILFVERGRLLDARVTLQSARLESATQLKLRFTPCTTYGGIVKPALGFHDQLQNCRALHTECLCFIQADSDADDCVTYRKLSGGQLVMETPFLNQQGIYRVFFPFLNSKCPSTCKKDVHVVVSVLGSDDVELTRTHFQVVCCATPTRDAKRFRNRQMETAGCRSINDKKLSKPGDQSVISNHSDTSLSGLSDYCSGSANDSYQEYVCDSPANRSSNHVGMKRKREHRAGSNSDREVVYTIQTKSRRIYNILKYLNEELSIITKK